LALTIGAIVTIGALGLIASYIVMSLAHLIGYGFEAGRHDMREWIRDARRRERDDLERAVLVTKVTA
jgi:hypothetical protein